MVDASVGCSLKRRLALPRQQLGTGVAAGSLRRRAVRPAAALGSLDVLAGMAPAGASGPPGRAARDQHHTPRAGAQGQPLLQLAHPPPSHHHDAAQRQQQQQQLQHTQQQQQRTQRVVLTPPVASATNQPGRGPGVGASGVALGILLTVALQLVGRWLQQQRWAQQLLELDARRSSGRDASTSGSNTSGSGSSSGGSGGSSAQDGEAARGRRRGGRPSSAGSNRSAGSWAEGGGGVSGLEGGMDGAWDSGARASSGSSSDDDLAAFLASISTAGGAAAAAAATSGAAGAAAAGSTFYTAAGQDSAAGTGAGAGAAAAAGGAGAAGAGSAAAPALGADRVVPRLVPAPLRAVQSRREGDTSHPGRHRAPVWNQEFQFLVEDPNVQVLEMLVKDSHLTGRTEVGRASIRLADLLAAQQAGEVPPQLTLMAMQAALQALEQHASGGGGGVL
ncbi:hypothetical protein TSOC_002284 [Tetrabaena socialis]|uniref:C2 domain-containing protein n=1 Tax=Tetrabaena socialis TaxID=47790 RepID=A0A2J8AEG8_9CHLO|nr:hypothetical protein TSOC_002284 [Tetrabaena socialis]|eukprot:PNH10918.1 hypothetical protein TSOC_002284 [Tetrabaena socialis]